MLEFIFEVQNNENGNAVSAITSVSTLFPLATFFFMETTVMYFFKKLCHVLYMKNITNELYILYLISWFHSTTVNLTFLYYFFLMTHKSHPTVVV